ncbi:MAG: hypothetical protein O3C43_20620 [Verrucomicrobia bacterium]|nr:hypothetical protein [Verrucomicrobiota bacterium]MDA1068897.1 hypothetical protein [Verrucomicrobiota bacterium]
MDALAGNDLGKSIETASAITAIKHRNGSIRSIQINNDTWIEVDEVFSTLPLGLLVRLLSPALPEHILGLSRKIKFRNLILVALFIDKKSLSENASIYFPDPDIPFTRGYEPKNRCSAMAPEDKTSLVVEIPCYEDDDVWCEEEATLATTVIRKLTESGLFEENDVSDYKVRRMFNAYPVLSQESTIYNREIINYLGSFKNLVILGRNGRFEYTHTHDLMRDAKMTIRDYKSRYESIV